VENCVHHRLEGGQGVGQAEEYDGRFIQSFVGYKHCFLLILVFDQNFVVSPFNVESSEQGAVL